MNVVTAFLNGTLDEDIYIEEIIKIALLFCQGYIK
jgi:hypothetical protein